MMNIKTFVEIAVTIPADISIMIRGDHGIGKSQVVHQLGQAFGLQTTDRRLSQMTEGDIIGLPKVDGNRTTFLPVDWVVDACENPRLLFLDELNRASPEVMQAAFQLVLDRQLNNRHLHPETRVFAAINNSNYYTVNNVDPALLDRFFVVDLKPSVEEWLLWARTEGNVARVITDFIEGTGHKMLEIAVNEKSDLNAVTPSRRSWDRLSRTLKSMGIIDKPADQRFHSVCLGFIGTEATLAFVKYARDHKFALTVKDVFAYKSTEKLVADLKDMPISDMNSLCSEFEDKLVAHKFNEREAKRFAFFYGCVSAERRVPMWSAINKAKSKDMLVPLCTSAIVASMNQKTPTKYDTLKHETEE